MFSGGLRVPLFYEGLAEFLTEGNVPSALIFLSISFILLFKPATTCCTF
jgi:hypothetical protein